MRSSFGASTPVKEIIDSIVTSSLPPEEMLARLNSFWIDWYLTEKGDLMIKYWQVGAKDFVPTEHVARIREGQPVPPEAGMLEWLSAHLRELETSYAGQWIAAANNQVVAASDSLSALLEQLSDLGVKSPFVTQIPAGPAIWPTAYAG